MGAWEITTLIIGEVLLTLAAFSAIIALIVFSIRKPIRKHKPIDMLIFDKIKPRVNTINNKIMLSITFLGKAPVSYSRQSYPDLLFFTGKKTNMVFHPGNYHCHKQFSADVIIETIISA